MTDTANFFESANSRRGLYRVWVPLHNDGKGPLICIWIDPSMAGFESEACPEDAGIAAEEDSCLCSFKSLLLGLIDSSDAFAAFAVSN